MENSYTNLYQSRWLVNVGLNPNTADMHHIEYNYNGYNVYGEYDTSLCYDKKDAKDYEGCKDKYWPCWSYGRLIDLLPKYIKVSGVEKRYMLVWNVGEGEIGYYNGKNWLTKCVSIFILIEWLIKNEYINKKMVVKDVKGTAQPLD